MSKRDDDAPPPPEPGALATRLQVVELASGRRIEAAPASGGTDLLRIRGRDGAVVLAVELTDSGPILRFESAALEIVAPRSLDVACGTFRVEATESATITGGRIDIEASKGGVNLRASDDVRVDGERVLLNSSDPPMPVSWEEYLLRQKEREKKPHLADRAAGAVPLTPLPPSPQRGEGGEGP